MDYNDGNDMSFYYDALGNRWRTINGGTVNYQTNNLNQYTSVAGTAHTYDDNGNLAFDGQFRYYYDCESRLIDINDANDAPVPSYAYDYLGRRISRTIYGAPNLTIKCAYDGDRIIAEYDGSGTLLRKFIYGPGIDEPICLLEVADNNAVYYYHFDGLGSVVALSDVNSVLVERYTYDVFGRPTIRDANGTEIAASAFANPYLFTGRAYDAETGLYYYRARYYDYATGRFLQPDPSGYTDGLNLYTYGGDNPATMVDPSGCEYFASGPYAHMVGSMLDGMSQTPVGKQMADFIKDPQTGPFYIRTHDFFFVPDSMGNNTASSFYPDMQISFENSTLRISRTGTINWNPFMGCYSEDNTVISPFILFANECGHALLWGRDRVWPQDEMDVIRRFENPVASAFGEDVRTTHNGLPFPTTFPTSTQCDWEKVKEWIFGILDPFGWIRGRPCKGQSK